MPMPGNQMITLGKDFPKLIECPESPWKKQTEFFQWMNRIMTYANGMHSQVGTYVAHCMRDAEHYFFTVKDAPDANVCYQGWKELDLKLVAVCLGALPDRIANDCYKKGRNCTFTQVLYNVFSAC